MIISNKTSKLSATTIHHDHCNLPLKPIQKANNSLQIKKKQLLCTTPDNYQLKGIDRIWPNSEDQIEYLSHNSGLHSD